MNPPLLPCASREVGPADARGIGNLALGNLARAREQLRAVNGLPRPEGERGREPGLRKHTSQPLNESPTMWALPTLAGRSSLPLGGLTRELEQLRAVNC